MGRDHPRQGDLFAAAHNSGDPAAMELQLNRQQLLIWQQRLSNFQQPKLDALNQGGQQTTGQIDLFGGAVQGPADTVHRLNPLALTAQHLQFWRWPEQQGSGAAIYFVLDRPPHLPGHLLLYVGETAQADRRWKGEHDCKSYLAAYGEALQQAGLSSQPSIRFWHDAPSDVKPRRALEQALIRHWLPPFNKETRRRWATPFTADAG
jgi:hypothetical protein